MPHANRGHSTPELPTKGSSAPPKPWKKKKADREIALPADRQNDARLPTRSILLFESALAEHRIEHFFVEAHNGGFADAHGRRPQVPGRAEHFLDHFLERRTLHVKGVELIALRHQNLGRFHRDGSCIGFAELPARRNLFFDHNIFGIQNLGRFCATRSTLAGIVPVDLLGHVRILLDQSDAEV